MKWSDKTMYLNDLMAKRHMTRDELYRLSGVPDSTLRGILSGGAQLENCKTGTLYGIAKALHIPMEALLEGASYGLPEDDACTGYPPVQTVHDAGSLLTFYDLVDAVKDCLCVYDGPDYMELVRDLDLIEHFSQHHAYRAALFLLGLNDYLCRKQGAAPDARYDALRCMRLDRPVYSLDTLEVDDSRAFEQAKAHAEGHAISELSRFHIFMTEEDIRRKV